MFRLSRRCWNKALKCKVKTTIYVSRDDHDRLWIEEHVEMSCPHTDEKLDVIQHFAGDHELSYAR